MGSSVRVSAITSNASLVVALTLRVEDWEVQSGGSVSGLPDLELTDVLLIDQGNTKDGLVELAEARTRCPTARAIVIGDEEADVSDLDRLLLRPFTLEDLANAINEAGELATADGKAAEAAAEDDLVALDDEEPDEWAEPEPFEADDLLTSATAAEPPPPVAIDEPLVLDEEELLEPPRDEDEFTPAGVEDEPGTFNAADELHWIVPESISPAPSQPVVEEEPAPFEADELDASKPLPAAVAPIEELADDEPAPFAADLAPPVPTTLEDDDELEPWSAEVEAAPAQAPREAVVADELAAAPPVTEPDVEEGPSAEEELDALARATGRGDRSTRRKARRSRRKKGETLPGPTELAAELMASVAPRQRTHADLNARIAEILTTGLDLELLLEEMPILRSRATLGTALAAELAQDLEAETVSAWIPHEKGFQVAGGWGLTRAELKARVPASQPLLSELSETGGATLIVPIDLAGAAVAGIAGARTKALMATAIGIGHDRYAFVALGADNYEEEDLDALVEMAVEAAPLFAVAAMIDRLRDT